MAARPIDLRGAIVADLPRGRIETADRRRIVALPSEWLESLLGRPGTDLATLGRSLGEWLESDARAALGDGADPSPEDVAYAISAALAARGLGLVRFEQWGDALVMAWRDPPAHGDAWGELAASATAAVIGKLAGATVSAASLGEERGELRILVADSAVCQTARERVRAGDGLPEILKRLDRQAESS